MFPKLPSLTACLPALALIAAAPARAHDMEAPQGPSAPAGDSLPGLVAQALKNNPGIKAEEFQVKALHSSPSHAWYLEPPQVGVEFYQAPVRSFPDPLKNQMEIDYSIQQAIPFPGKISSRIQAEHRHAEMGEGGLAALRRKIAREVKTDYYELYLLDRRMDINRQNQALMGRLIEIARRQYEVGMGRQADILRAQTEATNLKTDSIMLAQSRAAMEGMLDALLNRKAGSPLRVTGTLTPFETDWPLDRLTSLLEDNHPELKAMRAAIRMREAEKTMAKKEFLPDFTVGGSYKDMLRIPAGTHGAGLEDYWSVMIGMNVPVALWSLPKYTAGVAQSNARLGQAEQEYIDAKNTVFARVQEAYLKVKGSKEIARISRSVLAPQATQALESTLAAYQGGKSEFMTLLDAYRMSLMAKENSETALTRLLTSQAELEEAVGMDLEEIQKKISEGAGR